MQSVWIFQLFSLEISLYSRKFCGNL